MQIRLREHHVPRQHKPRRKTDGKSDHPGANVGRDGVRTENGKRMPMKNMIVSQRVEHDTEHCVRATASKVAESLGRYDLGERPVKKIYEPNYDMSDPVVHL